MVVAIIILSWLLVGALVALAGVCIDKPDEYKAHQGAALVAAGPFGLVALVAYLRERAASEQERSEP